MVSRLKWFLAGLLISVAFGAAAAVFPYFGPVTGILKGNANDYHTTAATGVDIAGTFTGMCDSSTFLGGDGVCRSVGAPTGSALTRVNDTNVTLTLGGSPASALLASTSITAGWSGTLAASRGGTGVGTLGDLTRTNDTNVTLTLGGTPTGALITSTSLTLGWTGTLAAARGGTDGASPTDDGLMVGSGTAWVTKVLTTCTGAGKAVTYDASTNAFGCNTISSGSPGGSTTQVQYNSSGSFAGDADFTWADTTNILSLGSVATPAAITGLDTAASANGSALTVRPGDSSSNGVGGALTIRGGASAGAAHAGGAVTMTGGSAGSTGNGGAVTLTGGAAVSGNGGNMTVAAGGGDAGGTAVFRGGDASGSAAGGPATIRGGDAGATAGAGGALTVRAGDGSVGGISGAGGALTVRAGNASSSQTAGDVTIAGGDSASGTDGSIILQTGGSTRMTIEPDGSFNIGGNGTSGQVLTSNGASSAPTWQTAGAVTQTTGTFTVNWVQACTTTPVQNWNYTKTGDIVTITPVDTFNCTSDSTSFISTGNDLPAAIRPNTARVVDLAMGVQIQDNGVTTGACLRIESDNSLAVSISTAGFCSTANNWTNTGTKQWNNSGQFSFTYAIDGN